jgi:hypothetical protein
MAGAEDVATTPAIVFFLKVIYSNGLKSSLMC